MAPAARCRCARSRYRPRQGAGAVRGKDAARLTVELELPVDHGIWIAAKCDAGNGQVAHTTPVYVTVNGGGFHNPQTLRQNLAVAKGI